MALTYELTREPAATDVQVIATGLKRHAMAEIGEDGFKPVAVFVRDDSDAIRAGVSAYVNWNWLQVSLLWVADELRGRGIGSELLAKVESIARQDGCDRAHVSTLSFQAVAFYEIHGYSVFATLEDYPTGQAKHFLRKDL